MNWFRLRLLLNLESFVSSLHWAWSFHQQRSTSPPLRLGGVPIPQCAVWVMWRHGGTAVCGEHHTVGLLYVRHIHHVTLEHRMTISLFLSLFCLVLSFFVFSFSHTHIYTTHIYVYTTHIYNTYVKKKTYINIYFVFFFSFSFSLFYFSCHSFFPFSLFSFSLFYFSFHFILLYVF